MNFNELPLAGKTSLRKVPLNSGGYEFGTHGQYWGTGVTLWRAVGNESGCVYVRAHTREEAKKEIAKMQVGVEYSR